MGYIGLYMALGFMVKGLGFSVVIYGFGLS